MARTPVGTLLLVLSLTGCASQAHTSRSFGFAYPSADRDHSVVTFASRPASDDLRRVEDPRSGLRSVLLPPSSARTVHGSPSVRRPTVLVGALYAVAPGPGVESAGLALVIRVIGGDVGAALESGAGVRVIADGRSVVPTRRIARDLYSTAREGDALVETLMIPMLPAELKALASGADVLISLGDAIGFGLTRAQQSGLGAMAGEIPDEMRFGRRLVAPPRRFSATD